MKKRNAFTLAEVLITLGIIGIVAAMTLPVLTKKYHESVTINAVQASYSLLQNAYLNLVNDYGSPENWSSQSYVSVMSENYLNLFAKQLKFSKLCGRDITKTCLGNRYVTLSGSLSDIQDSMTTSARGILSNGNLIVFYITQANCNRNLGNTKLLQNVCGWVFVDINGQRKPNKIGEDGFYFWISKYGMVPIGTPDETFEVTSFKTSCSDLSSHYGWGCSAWLLINKNMDYLKCNGLDWDSKTSCK